MAENYYTILGLDKNKSTQYTDAEIKKAYRKMAMKYHPDRNQGNAEAENKFKDIQKAYDVLSDKDKRHNYDTYGSEDGAQYTGGASAYGNYDFGGFDFADLFKNFASSSYNSKYSNDEDEEFLRNYNRNTQKKSESPKNNNQIVEISLKDFLNENNRTHILKIKVPAGTTSQTTCQMCHGTGSGKYSMYADLMSSDRCFACNGTGYVQKQEFIDKMVKVTIPPNFNPNKTLKLSNVDGRKHSSSGNSKDSVSNDVFISFKIKDNDQYQLEVDADYHYTGNIITHVELHLDDLDKDSFIIQTPFKNGTEKLYVNHKSLKSIPGVIKLSGKGIDKNHDMYIHVDKLILKK